MTTDENVAQLNAEIKAATLRMIVAHREFGEAFKALAEAVKKSVEVLGPFMTLMAEVNEASKKNAAEEAVKEG